MSRGAVTRSSTLRIGDAVSLGAINVRQRPGRSSLSALGVAIGIAAIVAVAGISASSRADLLARLDRLGTNLLTVGPGESLTSRRVPLSPLAPAMIRRIPLVHDVAAVGALPDTGIRRSPFIPRFETGGLGLVAAEPDLPRAVGARLRSGVFFDAATSSYPVAVLGTTAASHLGVTDAGAQIQVWIADRPFLVIGLLAPVALAPELDRSVLVGWPEAEALGVFDGHPTTVYVRTQVDSVAIVRAILARTADPAHPEDVQVSRPSDALAARAAAGDAFTDLLVGLGSLALAVGAIGIANVLLIAVLERRTEIGVRRALGATRRHIAMQFLLEALVLGILGGATGCLAGSAITAIFATAHGWRIDLPVSVLAGAMLAGLATSALGGAYPAIRASRVAPMEALRAT
jgi:putative ABC transport system permease protein